WAPDGRRSPYLLVRHGGPPGASRREGGRGGAARASLWGDAVGHLSPPRGAHPGHADVPVRVQERLVPLLGGAGDDGLPQAQLPPVPDPNQLRVVRRAGRRRTGARGGAGPRARAGAPARAAGRDIAAPRGGYL